jgi:hypothetical protein
VYSNHGGRHYRCHPACAPPPGPGQSVLPPPARSTNWQKLAHGNTPVRWCGRQHTHLAPVRSALPLPGDSMPKHKRPATALVWPHLPCRRATVASSRRSPEAARRYRHGLVAARARILRPAPAPYRTRPAHTDRYSRAQPSNRLSSSAQVGRSALGANTRSNKPPTPPARPRQWISAPLTRCPVRRR